MKINNLRFEGEQSRYSYLFRLSESVQENPHDHPLIVEQTLIRFCSFLQEQISQSVQGLASHSQSLAKVSVRKLKK